MKNAIIGAVATILAAPIAEAGTCPSDMTVGSVLLPGFSCTLGDKTFSDFVISGIPLTSQVLFGQLGPLFAVTLSRDGTFIPEGTAIFDYTISAPPGMTIREASVGVDVSFPSEVTDVTMGGQSIVIHNGGTAEITFTPGLNSLVVDNTSHILTPFADLNSLSNNFSQTLIGVPEPGVLGLMGLGAIGLAFTWFRRRK